MPDCRLPRVPGRPHGWTTLHLATCLPYRWLAKVVENRDNPVSEVRGILEIRKKPRSASPNSRKWRHAAVVECASVVLAVLALAGFPAGSLAAGEGAAGPACGSTSPAHRACESGRAAGSESASVSDSSPGEIELGARGNPAERWGNSEPIELTAADGVRVLGDLYEARGPERGVVVLFHQAGSNAAEYAPIAPRLAAHGLTCLAIDQRSGGRMWGRGNRTVAHRGRSTDFLSAYPDLEAALAWARTRRPGGPVLVWGSSYTAALVLRLAAEHAGEIDAVLSFSPGEYLGPGEPVREWASKVRQPLFVTSAPGREVAAAARIIEASPSPAKEQFVAEKGVHASSILREDRNPGATAPVWRAVEGFVERVLASGHRVR